MVRDPQRDGPVLLADLSDQDPFIRRAAALALGDIGWNSQEAANGLIRLLSDPDEDTRLYAAAGLMKLSDIVVDPLLEVLRHSELVTHDTTLTRTGPKEWKFPSLVAAYVLSKRPAAAQALTELAAQRPIVRLHGSNVSRVLTLQWGDVAYPRMALRHLGLPAVEAMISGLRRTDLYRPALLDLLARFADDIDVAAWLPSIVPLLTDADQETREAGARFLFTSGEKGRLLLRTAAQDGTVGALEFLRKHQLSVSTETHLVEMQHFSKLNYLEETDMVTLARDLNDPSDFVQFAATGNNWNARGPISETALHSILTDLELALRSREESAGPALRLIRLLGGYAAPLADSVRRWIGNHKTHPELSEALVALESFGMTEESAQTIEQVALSSGSDEVILCAEILNRWSRLSPGVLAAVAEATTHASAWWNAQRYIDFLVKAGPQGLTHVRKLAAVQGLPARYPALISLGSTNSPSDIQLMAQALTDGAKSDIEGAMYGLRNALNHRSSNQVNNILQEAGIRHSDLVARLEQLINIDNDFQVSAFELLFTLQNESSTSRLIVEALGSNDDLLRVVRGWMSERPQLASTLHEILVENLHRGRLSAGAYIGFRLFPDESKSELPTLVSIARQGDERLRILALETLLEIQPQNSLVSRFLRDCARQDSFLELAVMASERMFADSTAKMPQTDAAQWSMLEHTSDPTLNRRASGPDPTITASKNRLYTLALREIETGHGDRANTILRAISWPMNDPDPMIEINAVRIYLRQLVDFALRDPGFSGENGDMRPGKGEELRTGASSPAQFCCNGPSDEYLLHNTGLPLFDWPPPVYSERDRITDLFGAREGLTLGSIDAKLSAALTMTGYGTGGLYQIDGGFLRVTKLEQLMPNRAQAPAPYRFVDTDIPPQGLIDYLGALFLARPGVYRSILFAVTSAGARPNPASRLTQEDAKHLYLRGEPGSLPRDVSSIRLADRECYVLIYEFEKQYGSVHQVLPSPLSAREHLSRAHILNLLSAPVR